MSNLSQSPGNVKLLVRSVEEGRADGQRCKEAAFQYHKFDWSLLVDCPPCHVGVGLTHARGCTHPGKAPFGYWKEFETKRASIATLERKFRDLPNGNVGLVYGRVSGVVGI